MTPAETARVLAVAAAFDRRTVGKADVLAWHGAIGLLDYSDATAAVQAHYAETTAWIMPADVVGRVRAVRRLRAAQTVPPLPTADPDDPAAWRADLARLRRGVASAPAAPAQLTKGIGQ